MCQEQRSPGVPALICLAMLLLDSVPCAVCPELGVWPRGSVPWSLTREGQMQWGAWGEAVLGEHCARCTELLDPAEKAEALPGWSQTGWLAGAEAAWRGGQG